MKVSITNGQIVAMLNVINKIKESDRKLPIRLSYAINKNIQALMNCYKPYEESLKDMGLDNLSSDKLNNLTKDQLQEFTDLYSCKNEIDMFTVKLSDIEHADLSINEVEVIQTFMLEEEND